MYSKQLQQPNAKINIFYLVLEVFEEIFSKTSPRKPLHPGYILLREGLQFYVKFQIINAQKILTSQASKMNPIIKKMNS